VRALIIAAGFVERAWLAGAEVKAAVKQSSAGPTPLIPSPTQLGPGLLMGPDAGVKIAAIERNMRAGRTTLGLGVFERA